LTSGAAPLPRYFCDANVLSPSLLRDLLIRLAIVDLPDLHWSDEVHDEYTRNLLLNHPDLTPVNSPARAARWRPPYRTPTWRATEL
jgi:hypothetical protein